MNTYIIIFCTTPSHKISLRIAEACINKKVAACCNIIPGITSIYQWQGKVEKSEEELVLLKTIENNFNAIENIINDIHPYEVPEIISVQINNGNKPYLKWIDQSQR